MEGRVGCFGSAVAEVGGRVEGGDVCEVEVVVLAAAVVAEKSGARR